MKIMQLNPISALSFFKKYYKLNQTTETKKPALNSCKNFSYDKSRYIGFYGNSVEPFNLKLEKFLKKPDDELYNFLNTELSKKANEKNINHQIAQDVIQDAIFEIFLLIQKHKSGEISKEDVINEIGKIVENLKPTKDNYVFDINTTSIDKPILGYDISISDTIPDNEEYKISYLSAPDNETREKFKNEVNQALSNSKLTQKQEEALRARYSDETLSYKEIAEKVGITQTAIYLRVRQALLKVQAENNSLPNTAKKKIEEFAEYFNFDYDVVLNMVLKYPQILNYSKEWMLDNIKALVDRFANNGVTLDNYILACLKRPSLFYQSHKTTEKNIKNLVDRFTDHGLTLDNYIPACLKQPSLFYLFPETIEGNIKGVVEKFEDNGLTLDNYISACLKQPSLFYRSPETIEKNIKDLVNKFADYGLTLDGYIPACLKQPSLFCQSPETIEKNVKSMVDKFTNHGLTLDNYISACLKQPSLFYRSPETIEKNVKSMVDKFADQGLTLDNYIPGCIKQPSLFFQSPETIEKKVKDLVNKFAVYGLTLDNCIHVCIRQPSLFFRSPETIEKNVKDLVDKFADCGLSLDNYIPACLKQPQLFCLSSETIAKHINLLRFCEYNTNSTNNKGFWQKYLKRPVSFTYSTLFILIKELIIPKMFEGQEVPKELKGDYLRQKLNNYLINHPDNNYQIRVKNIESDIDCIKVLDDILKDISKKALNRDNVFELVVEE